MKRSVILIVLLLAVCAFAKPKPLGADGEPYYEFVPNHVLVAFSKAIPPAKIDEIITRSGGKVGSYSELLDFYRVEMSRSAREGIEYFRAEDERAVGQLQLCRAHAIRAK